MHGEKRQQGHCCVLPLQLFNPRRSRPPGYAAHVGPSPDSGAQRSIEASGVSLSFSN